MHVFALVGSRNILSFNLKFKQKYKIADSSKKKNQSIICVEIALRVQAVGIPVKERNYKRELHYLRMNYRFEKTAIFRCMNFR